MPITVATALSSNVSPCGGAVGTATADCVQPLFLLRTHRGAHRLVPESIHDADGSAVGWDREDGFLCLQSASASPRIELCPLPAALDAPCLHAHAALTLPPLIRIRSFAAYFIALVYHFQTAPARHRPQEDPADPARVTVAGSVFTAREDLHVTRFAVHLRRRGSTPKS